MTVDLERLLVRIEANQRTFEKQLGSVRKSVRDTTRVIERDFAVSNQRAAASTQRAARMMSASYQAIAAGLGARAVQGYADAWTEANNKIAAASEISGKQSRSLSDLNDLADETRSGLSETVDLYAKLLRSTKDVAKSEEEVARATSIVNKAFKAGGAAASEQAAGILQLAQGLSSQALQGDELRSVRENAPLLAQAIADEFETTIGGLKDLGAEGAITADRVFKAILAAEENIEAAFSRTNATIGQSFTRLQNALIEYVAAGDDAVGGTEKIATALAMLADNLDLVAVGMGALAIRGVAPLAVALAVKLAAAAATATAAIQLMNTGAGVALVTTTALTRALALLGGPMGLILTVGAGVALAFANSADAAENLASVADDLEGTLGKISTVSATLADDYRDLEAAEDALTRAKKDGGDAAVQAATLEVDSVRKRVAASAALREEYAALARAQLAEAREAMRVAEEWALAQERDRLTPRASLKDGALFDQMADTAAAAKLDTDALRASIQARIDLALAASEAGEALTDEQKDLITLSTALKENELRVASLEAQFDALSGAAADVEAPLDNAGDAAARLGKKADTAASGVERLVKLIPNLHRAAEAEKRLTEAREARDAALAGLNTGRPEEEAQIARVNALYQEAVAEVSGLNAALEDQRKAATDANAALEAFADEAYLNSLDERARRVAVEKREYAELVEQLQSAGAAQADLDKASTAHQQRLAQINADIKRGGGSGGGAARIKDEMALSALFEREIASLETRRELIGKTVGEQAEILAKERLIEEAKRRKLPLDEEALRNIEEYAATIGRTVDEVAALEDAERARVDAIEEAKRAAEDFAEAQARADAQMVDGLVRATTQAESLEDALRRIALQLIEIAASDFFKGMLGLPGGGSSLGSLFHDLGAGLFSGGSGLPGSAGASGTLRVVPGATGFAGGGEARGPGGPRGDKIPAMLSDGEIVINAAASRRNRDLLMAINRGATPRAFASGGIVGAPARMAPSPTGGGLTRVTVINNAPVEVKTQKRRAAGGDELLITLDRMMAENASDPSSRFGSVMREGFGVQPGLDRR